MRKNLPASERKPLTVSRMAIVLLPLLGLLIVASVLETSIGSVSIPFGNVLGALTGSENTPETQQTIVMQIRLPRVLLGILVGAGLSIAGVVLQALLRNPLAEPYILGISSGGTVGAIIALSASLGVFGISLSSFAGSALVMLLVYALAHRRGQLDTYTLLLAGVMIGAFFNAAILLIIAVFTQELRNAFLWLMGNLSTARTESLIIVAPVICVISLALLWNAKSFNLIATGDETAMQLGVNVRSVKRISYLLASLLTGAVVSVSGVVGFVGLIIPHICRILFGPDHRLLLPAAALLGAIFLVLTDTIARTIIAPAEIPVGAVTAAIGAPLFVYLLRRG
jgi:iron complex transport system permease protein